MPLEVKTGADRLDVHVTGGYASDLLSCVMARAREGFVWVTLQAHPNIIAVAGLLNLSGIIITEGVTPDPATVEKADEQGVPILTTCLTTFTVVGMLAALGIGGAD
ncbi:MAG: serine kinase [Chloroflexi bacterium]|nr:serine kinase [Chloroflexota bacterium]